MDHFGWFNREKTMLDFHDQLYPNKQLSHPLNPLQLKQRDHLIVCQDHQM